MVVQQNCRGIREETHKKVQDGITGPKYEQLSGETSPLCCIDYKM